MAAGGGRLGAALRHAATTVAEEDDTQVGRDTPFTGTRIGLVPDTTDEEWWVEDAVGHARVYRLEEQVEWSDPRLPTTKQTY